MAKQKSVFICQKCAAESPKWIGKCPSCGEWNSYVEEVVVKERSGLSASSRLTRSVVKPIHEITSIQKDRLITGISEFDRILGGGVVPGSLILLGGDPGIGKSTLALQVAMEANFKVLYVSGEESDEQIKMRAERLGVNNKNCYVLCETLLDEILNHIHDVSPALVVIDSIQTLYTDQIESSPGSVSQVRECSSRLLRLAKETGTPILLIGHITKEGTIAGPKVLEHIVDTVLQFEGDLNHVFRILRVNKNRFGATSELAIFEMRESGLIQVLNPSEILISQSDEELSGVAIAATIDGLRPYLVEIQSLVSSAVYGTPQRSSTGFDTRRLNMLLAVLEKKASFRLATKDVFINIAGGLRISDPAVDLALVVAILSSSVDLPVSKKICFAAEVGLTGEVRPVSRIIQRIKEAEKLGFEKIYISRYNSKNIKASDYKIKVVFIGRVEELVKSVFAGNYNVS